MRNTGLPSASVGFCVISMPVTSRPSHDLWLSVIGLTMPGFCSASCLSSNS